MSLQNDALQEQNEEQLIRKSLRGDLEAVEALFGRHSRALYQTALRVLGNPEDAEDALQEGLLSAFRSLRRFEGRSQFSTWLTRIIINAALMRRRSLRVRPAVSLDEPQPDDGLSLADRCADTGPNPEQVYAQKELHAMLKENLEDLSPLLRSAFLLRDVEGLSTGEAAKKLGVSQNTLKARLWRARQQLVARLGRHLRRGPSGGDVSTDASHDGRYGLGGLPYAYGTE